MTTIDIDQFAHDDPALHVLRSGDVGETGCIMLWVQRAQRARANLAVNIAVELAKAVDLPVVAVFCLVPSFPSATHRHYHFMAEGLQELPDAFAARKIGWHLAVGDPAAEIPKATRRLDACVVVTDINPLRIGRQWRDAVADELTVPMIAVDADVVVPSALFEKEEYAPRTIRPKLQREFDRYMQPIPDIEPPKVSDVKNGADPMDVIAGFELDRSVGPAPDLRGGSSVARKRLLTFIDERLTRYDQDRSRADIDAGSGLSPWLHYGQVGPTEIAVAVNGADAPASARDGFIDELVTQREIAINYALRNPRYDAYAGLPDWSKDSLEKHRDDPRDPQFTASEFEAAATDDRLWNTAMWQMIHEGWLPNRLRMYWAKQILLWSPSAQAAWRTTVHLNDKYFVDGRDANSYANIAWSIGGRHDRPFGPERPITGLVRPMGMGAMKRTFDVDAYIDKVESRWGTPGGARPDGHSRSAPELG